MLPGSGVELVLCWPHQQWQRVLFHSHAPSTQHIQFRHQTTDGLSLPLLSLRTPLNYSSQLCLQPISFLSYKLSWSILPTPIISTTARSCQAAKQYLQPNLIPKLLTYMATREFLSSLPHLSAPRDSLPLSGTHYFIKSEPFQLSRPADLAILKSVTSDLSSSGPWLSHYHLPSGPV